MKSGIESSGFAALPAMRVERRLEKGHRRDAGNFDRILKGEKHAFGRALVRRQFEDVLAVEQDLARRDFIIRLAGDDIGERRLAGAVRPHDRRDLAVSHLKVEVLQDFAVADRDVQVLNFQHGFNPCGRRRGRQPTLPSSETAISFCASTANSIGNCCSTSRTKPLTITAVASSAVKPALHAIEELILGDFRGRRLMLELRRAVIRLDIGHRMRAAVVADQQRVAIGEIARARRLAMRRDLAAIGVLRMAGGNALRDHPARRVLAEMDHLSAGIDLLMAVRNGDRIEFAARIVAAQNAGRIFPGDGRAGLDLRPRNLRARTAAVAALGDEIIDAALAFANRPDTSSAPSNI